MDIRKISGRKILVTGGGGFIGSNLCIDLIDNGNKVVCLDNFSTGKYENLETIIDHPYFKLIEGDIRNIEDCQQAVKNIDFVLHHAALGSVPRSIKDPKTSHDVNVTGFLNMLQASYEAKVQRFIYASSSSVYGDHPTLPKTEDHLGRPLSPYAVTKRSNELYAQCFKDLYKDMWIIGLRYFNVFGRRQDPNGSYAAAIPKFIDAFVKHKSPIVYGNGMQSRDFTYVDNVIHANHLALLTENTLAKNEIFNIACESQITVLEMINHISKYLSKYDADIVKITPSYAPIRQGDILHSHACTQKAKRMLGYAPLYDFEEGLKQSIEWYWQHLNCMPTHIRFFPNVAQASACVDKGICQPISDSSRM